MFTTNRSAVFFAQYRITIYSKIKKIKKYKPTIEYCIKIGMENMNRIIVITDSSRHSKKSLCVLLILLSFNDLNILYQSEFCFVGFFGSFPYFF